MVNFPFALMSPGEQNTVIRIYRGFIIGQQYFGWQSFCAAPLQQQRHAGQFFLSISGLAHQVMQMDIIPRLNRSMKAAVRR